MWAGVEEAELWDGEKYNLSVSLSQDTEISKMFKEVDALHELFPVKHEFWLRWMSRMVDDKWL